MYFLDKTLYPFVEKFLFFNKLMFNNAIDFNFPVGEYTDAPNSWTLGVVKVGQDSILGLYLKTTNKLPTEVFDVILIHEMIHAYLYQTDKEAALVNKGHGPAFMKLRDTLIRRFPEYPIPVKEDIAAIESILDRLEGNT